MSTLRQENSPHGLSLAEPFLECPSQAPRRRPVPPPRTDNNTPPGRLHSFPRQHGRGLLNLLVSFPLVFLPALPSRHVALPMPASPSNPSACVPGQLEHYLPPASL